MGREAGQTSTEYDSCGPTLVEPGWLNGLPAVTETRVTKASEHIQTDPPEVGTLCFQIDFNRHGDRFPD